MPMAYAELHCLSNFSFLRAASHPQELVQRAHALGYRALALTDECSVSGVVRAHERARELGLALIIGSELRLRDGMNNARLVLLATDRTAYAWLCRLITTGRRRSTKGEYELVRADLDRADLSGCLALFIPPLDLQIDPAELDWFAARFAGCGWLAVELLRDGRDVERLDVLADLGERHGLPLVAAGDVHMHARGRRRAAGPAHRDPPEPAGGASWVCACPNGERHLRALRASWPSSIRASCWTRRVRIAERCRFSLDELRYEYPDDVAPAGAHAARAGCAG